MAQAAALGVLGIAQQSGGGGVGLPKVLPLPGTEAGGLQLCQEFAQAQCGIELKGGTFGQAVRALQQGAQIVGQFRAEHDFAGRNARQPVGQLIGCAFGQVQFALRQAQPRQAATAGTCRTAAGMHGQQKGFAFVGEQFAVGQGAGRDHPHHLALHRPFAADFAHLLTDGYRFAMANQPCQVIFNRVKRHACHHHRLARRLAALGQGDVQQAGGFFGVAKKQLVEIAHAVEHQRAGELGLDGQVLGHHGGVLREVCGCHAVAAPERSLSGVGTCYSGATGSVPACACNSATACTTAALSCTPANFEYFCNTATICA